MSIRLQCGARVAVLALVVVVGVSGSSELTAQARPEPRVRPVAEDFVTQAEMLAAELLTRSDQPPEELPVSPSPALVDSILRGLVAVFELKHPARDTVFEMYQIRPPIEGVYSATIDVDSLAPWLERWRGGDVITGLPAVDSILDPLEVSSLQPREMAFRGDEAFEVHFARPVSWWVLRERLMRVPHIVASGPTFLLIGGGHHLTLERRADGWRFRFSVGWGDCPSGCVNRRDWIFEFDDELGARFVESSGDPLPMRRSP